VNPKYFLFTIFVTTLFVFLIVNSFLTTANEVWIVLAAWALALVHVISGFYMSRWAIAKPAKTFLTIVMGGMGLRMLMVAIAIVVLIKLLNVDVELFVITFGIYYFLFQIVEIHFINRGLQLKKVMKS